VGGVPPASAQVVGQALQARPQLVLGRAGEEGDPGADVRIEVGIRPTPVGGTESVEAVMRDRHRSSLASGSKSVSALTGRSLVASINADSGR
jgi:hypothetical protein